MSIDNIYQDDKQPSTLRNAARHFYRNTMGMVGLYGVCTLLLLCLFGALLSPYGVDQQFLGYQLLPPSWSRYGDVSFFLGTDDLGRDILSRLLHGAAPTIGSALLVTLFSSLCAILLGIIFAVSSRLRLAPLSQMINLLLALPSLLIAMIVVAFCGPSLLHALVAVWLALMPRIFRSVNLAIKDEMEKEYIMAARLDGASPLVLLKGAIFPNILPMLVSEFTRAFSLAILDISALGLLGMGAQLPSTEWGVMVNNSLDLIYVAPWTVMLPGSALMLSILLINLLGNGVRLAFEAGVK